MLFRSGGLTWSVGSASLQTAWLLQTGSGLLRNGLCPEQSCTRSSVCLVCGGGGGGVGGRRSGRDGEEQRDGMQGGWKGRREKKIGKEDLK